MKRKVINIIYFLISILAFFMIFLPVCKNDTETVYGIKAIFGSGLNADPSPLGIFLFILILLNSLIAYGRIFGKFDTNKYRIILVALGLLLMCIFLLFNRTVMLKGNDYPSIWVNTLDLSIGAVLGALLEFLGSMVMILYIVLFKGDKNE